MKGVEVEMTEMVLDTRTTPIREESVDCPFAGMFADGKVSSEKFIAQKQIEKELEQ